MQSIQLFLPLATPIPPISVSHKDYFLFLDLSTQGFLPPSNKKLTLQTCLTLAGSSSTLAMTFFLQQGVDIRSRLQLENDNICSTY